MTPKPALKYQLLPELKEMSPGNPILDYMRCFAEQQNFFHSKAEPMAQSNVKISSERRLN